MRKKDIYAVILAGGKGERLWPKSRTSLPKQNLRLLGGRSFIQHTVNRAGMIAPDNIFIITTRLNSRETVKQLKKSKAVRIIPEPLGRNTAPAVGLAALLAFRENKDSILVVMPSDAVIKGEKKFFRAVNTAVKAAGRHDAVITLGIKPASPESAYGYIGIGRRPGRVSGRPRKAVCFIEKPGPRTAARLIKSKRFFWNSGIFIFRASVMIEMLKKHTPALYGGLMALPDARKRRAFDAKLKKLYGSLKSESLDYAVLEKSKDIQVVPSDFGWSDLGSFESIARLEKKDKKGNLISGGYVGIDTKESLVFSDKKRLVAALGVKGLLIAATPDAVLVCDRSRVKDIKKLVEKMKKNKALAGFL